MVNEGPTTAGSINAKIGATITELQEKVAAAKALVKDLTGEKTNVKVGANVDEAITKLSAVEAAQRRLNTSTQSLQLAYQRLDEVQTKGGASQSRLMALHLAATRAENAHADAVRNLAAAQAAETAAEDENTAATVRSNSAQKDRLQHWQVIAIAVAALIPLLGPLTGYAVGVAGALGLMGAAGVLAIVGIKNAMQNGTAAGNQYSLGIQSLKGDLNELGNTSALSMLDSWNLAVGQINAAMPFLNSSTGLFAKQLGQTGNFLLGGVLAGLKAIQPLLLTSGVYVEQLAARFLQFTQGSGLQSFTQYAIRQLPIVAQALGQLAALAVRLIQATAPIGTVVLQALTGVAEAIQAIPLPVLTALVAGGGAFFLAFKAWSALTPIIQGVAVAIGAVGAAEDLALGPIGLVIAAVTALGAAVGITAVSLSNGAQAQQDYTAAVQQDNGVVGKNVELQAAKALQDEGALKNAKDLGISTNALVKAALGNADATAKVNSALDAQRTKLQQSSVAMATVADRGSAAKRGYDQQAAAIDNVSNQMQTQGGAIKSAIAAYNDLQKSLDGTTISTRAQLQAEQDAATQAGVSLSVYEQARAHQRDLASQLEQTTADMYVQGDAAGLLKQSLDLLNGKTLDAAQAQNQFDSQVSNMGAHIDKTGKDVNRATASLQGMSAAAVANRGELISATQAAEQSAEAFRANGGSAEDTRQKLIAMKQEIIDHAVAVGEDRAQVQALVDQLFKIPAKIPPTKIEVDDAAAAAKLQALQAQLNAIAKGYTLVLDGSGSVIGRTEIGSKLTARAAGGSIGDGPAGTVSGGGSSTSDSVLTRLSRGEEVTNASSASYPGVRSLLKSLNYDPSGTMAALNTPTGSSRSYVLHVNGAGWSPDQLFAEFQRRLSAQQNARVA